MNAYSRRTCRIIFNALIMLKMDLVHNIWMILKLVNNKTNTKSEKNSIWLENNWVLVVRLLVMKLRPIKRLGWMILCSWKIMMRSLKFVNMHVRLFPKVAFLKMKGRKRKQSNCFQAVPTEARGCIYYVVRWHHVTGKI